MQMQRKKYLIKNTVLFALNSIGTRLITFLLVPIYTAVLTTNEYGIADLVSTVVTIFVPIMTLNIGEAVMRFCLDEDADYNKIMSVGVTIGVASIFIGILIIPAIGLISGIADYKYYIAGYSIVQGIYQISICYLRGKEKLMEFAISNIIQVFSIAISNIIFLVILKKGLVGYYLSYILGSIIGTIFALAYGEICVVFSKFRFEKKLANSMIKYSIVLVPTSFMWWIMNSSDRIMVTAMVGVAENGIYAISYKVPTVLSVMSTIFNQAWSYSAIKEDSSIDREDFNNGMYDAFFNFQLFITGSLLVIIKPFLKIYVSDGYYSAWKYVPYLFIGYLFMSLGTFLSTSYTVNKDSKGFLVSGACGAIMNIILNWILIPRLGTAGAALSTCISYVTVFVYRFFDTRKYIKLNIFKWSDIIGIMVLILMGYILLSNCKFEQPILILCFLCIGGVKREFVNIILKSIKKFLTGLHP